MTSAQLQGGFIKELPTDERPAALKIQATVSLPNLTHSGFMPQDFIAFRANSFLFARVLQLGVRLEETSHGHEHILVLGVRGQASHEVWKDDSNPYEEETLGKVTSGMHLSVTLQIPIDTASAMQTVHVEVTSRCAITGAKDVMISGNLTRYPNFFYGLNTQHYPHLVHCYRSELLSDRHWAPHEKLDFRFQGDVHHLCAWYSYDIMVPTSLLQTPSIVINEGKIQPRPDSIVVLLRQPGNPNLEMAINYANALSALQWVLNMMKMLPSSPGPYQLRLTTHGRNLTKWYNMEHLQSFTVGEILEDTMRELPVPYGHTLDFMYVIHGH